MAHIIVDRRKNDKGKSTDNRRRFVRRVKDQVREAIKDVVRKGSIKDIVSDKGKRIIIPGKGLQKPTFHHGDGGILDHVMPGNKRHTQGDRIDRPDEGKGKGKGRKGGSDGEDDSFVFSLTREEFLEFFFQDLELPDMCKKEIAKLDEFTIRRAGFSVDGPPSRLNILRSMKLSKGRRFALRTPKKKKIKKLEKQLAELVMLQETDHIRYLTLCETNQSEAILVKDQIDSRAKLIVEIEEQIVALTRAMKAIPFIDDVDLRYNRWDKFPVPTTQAVMFGIMDVSGSMGEWEKEMAKRFFMLLLLFLTYNYERVDIVWIRHTTIADEVDEDEFFYSQQSGGTIVSSGLQKMSEIIKARYPPHLWNIFGCQISDGDNSTSDTPEAIRILEQEILSVVRYFAYIEIDRNQRKDSDIWQHYEGVKGRHKNMEMTVVSGPEQIYPTFRSLFEKRK